jgi:predicted kinase
MTPKLILIRGLPGAGKSTLAKKLKKPSWKHFEADMYHIQDGVYKFEMSRLSEAHAWCFDEASNAIREGNTVIVSNTFTTIRELQSYLNMAEDYNVPVEVIHCTGNFTSIHDVPELALQKMASRWQKYAGEKKINPKE